MKQLRSTSNNTRAGFLLLMLIAFASILLGLATTFYYYTSRGMDDSQMAVRVAQQRLAFSAAIKYVTSMPLTSSYLPSTGNANAVQLFVSSIARTQRMGWFRVARANTTYTNANWPTYDDTNSVYVTVGTGPSGGAVTPTNPNDWQLELRSWYLVNLTKLGAGTAGAIIPVFPPPAEYPAGTPIYW